jgi:hypothetical protein
MRSNGRAFQLVEVTALEWILISPTALPFPANIR